MNSTPTFAAAAGSVWPVVALYVGPYLVCNFWLVLYTWLQHTDVDVPHFEGDDWSLLKGAFMTIDRPYGAVFDFLHHKIGSTHVAHHINHTVSACVLWSSAHWFPYDRVGEVDADP